MPTVLDSHLNECFVVRLPGVRTEMDRAAPGGDDSFLVDQDAGKKVLDAGCATSLVRFPVERGGRR